MQLNIYIPKEKANILTMLEKTAELTKRAKNELVLEALDRYLRNVKPFSLGKFSLGELKLTRRSELYEGRLAD